MYTQWPEGQQIKRNAPDDVTNARQLVRTRAYANVADMQLAVEIDARRAQAEAELKQRESHLKDTGNSEPSSSKRRRY